MIHLPLARTRSPSIFGSVVASAEEEGPDHNQAATAQVRAWAAEFGLTPTAELRIGAVTADGSGEDPIFYCPRSDGSYQSRNGIVDFRTSGLSSSVGASRSRFLNLTPRKYSKVERRFNSSWAISAQWPDPGWLIQGV